MRVNVPGLVHGRDPSSGVCSIRRSPLSIWDAALPLSVALQGQPVQSPATVQMMSSSRQFPDAPSPVAPLPPIRALVFDLDGTLVDSAPDIHAATAAFLAERGNEPLDLATLTGFIGNGVPVLVERVLRAVGEAADPQRVQEIG